MATVSASICAAAAAVACTRAPPSSASPPGLHSRGRGGVLHWRRSRRTLELLHSRRHLLSRRIPGLPHLAAPRILRAQLKSDLDESSPLPSTAPASGESDTALQGLVGEDAAVFELSEQKTSSWVSFTIVLVVVLGALYVLWMDPSTGFGTSFVDALTSLSDDPEVVMLAILFVFALAHSGLASLRDVGEKAIGERAYRVLFGVVSLPLAVSAVVYFINHRYAGAQLWQVRTVPGVHELVWLLSFVSFFFLYPSTFNLLEVAAVDKPKMHMWETGIMRITRHPQMVGQFIWCFAHTLWIGTSFTLVTSLGLCAHHLLGVWNGDRRLAKRYGKAFEEVKRRTSIVPFAAIFHGRQKLPQDYYKEYLRVPYFVIAVLTVGAYFSHPLLQAGSAYLGW